MRLLTLPAGRRSKYAVLAIWLVIAGGAGSVAGKFESVQKNDPISYLPGDTESVRALSAVKRFPSGEITPAVIVARRPSGLTADDRRRLQSVVGDLRARPPRGVQGVGQVRRSKDGTTALLTVPIRARGDSDLLQAAVDRIRARVDRLGARPGLTAKVTGPAGFSKDAIEVFSNINGTLLTATAALVFVLLVLIYRSPVFWIIPLLSVGFAEVCSRAAGYGLAKAGMTINGQSAGILLVLVFGAGTDYALLLVARVREELRRHEDRHEAVSIALRRAGPAIAASAVTVVLALLVLLLARVNGTQALGPISAIGVLLAMASMLTLLPALLATFGRPAFWPFRPRYGSEGADELHGFWRGVGERVARHPHRVGIAGTTALVACCAGLLWFNTGLTQGNGFRGSVESVQGQRLVDKAFPSGENAPTTVVVPPRVDVARARSVAAGTRGVASAGGQVEQGPPGSRFSVVLSADPYSPPAYHTIERLRHRFGAAGLTGVLVGGPSAEERDTRAASARDDWVIPPIVLVVVFLVLAMLLRAVVLPLLLIGTVILSYGAALGIGTFFFRFVFGFPGADPGLPLFAFIFLVALGVDYNIFLMARVREETLRHGTRDGTLRGLAATGAVITSAGIVLAGTFSTLAVLPLVALTEIGFTIAVGVLLDTFLVRSVLVPALTFALGDRIWWPSRLARGRPQAD